MINKLSNYIKRKFCKHPSVNEYHSGAYCPDCGQRIIIKWYLLKCADCNSSLLYKCDSNGNLEPQKKHCSNCGSDRWYVKDSNKIDFKDRMYAIYKKEVVKGDYEEIEPQTIEIWIEEPDFDFSKYFAEALKKFNNKY